MSLIIAPIEVFNDPRLTASEFRVLLTLYSFRNRNANTVWPSRDVIAERANIADVARVSKITNELFKKGWLTKKRRGFSGGVEYCLTVPDDLPTPSQVVDFATMANFATVVKTTSSKVAKNATYNEQQNEQQKNNIGEVQPTPQKSSPVIEYKKIIESYNAILGDDLRKVRDLTDQRKKHIRARIEDDPRRANPEWWARYFEFVSHSDFLMGNGPKNPATGKPWAADFDWLTNQTNMTKTLERKYHAE